MEKVRKPSGNDNFITFKSDLTSGNLSYWSSKMQSLIKENVKSLSNANTSGSRIAVDSSNWGLLDSLAPYNFDLCMRQYAREVNADPILNISNKSYPVPLSIFSRGSTIHVTLAGSNNRPFPNYTMWLNNFTWKVKTNGLWTDCSTNKGRSKRGDSKQRYFLLKCENTQINR